MLRLLLMVLVLLSLLFPAAGSWRDIQSEAGNENDLDTMCCALGYDCCKRPPH